MLCLALALGGASPLHAGGQAESGLGEAEKLIQQQKYSDALRLLASIQKDKPDLADETARLIAQVMAVSQSYNKVLALLQEARVNGDIQAMQKLVAQLMKIDPSRAPEIAQSTSLLAGFLMLMNGAKDLLAAGKPADALARYMLPISDPAHAGFALPQKEFEAAGYGPLIVATVTQAVTLTLATATAAVTSASELAAIPTKLVSFLGGTLPPDSPSAFDALIAPLAEYAGSEGSVRALAASLMDIRATLQRESSTNRDSPYLQYLVWLCLGRQGTQEGIVYALQQLWEGSARSVAESVAKNAAQSFDSAHARFAAGALDAAAAAFSNAAARNLLSVKAAGLVSAALKTSAASGWGLSADDASRAAALAAQVSLAQEAVAEAGAYQQLIGYKSELAALPAVILEAPVDPAKSGADLALLASARATIAGRIEDSNAQQKLWTVRASVWDSAAASGAASARVGPSARAMAALFNEFALNELQRRDALYAMRIAAINGSGFPSRLASAIQLRIKGLDLRDGSINGEVPKGSSLVEKHPDLAIPVLAAASDNLDALIADISAQEQVLQAEKPWVKASAGYDAIFNGTAASPGDNQLLATARDERAHLDAYRAAALAQQDDAALASREGDNWFNQAQAALGKRDPDGAESFLDKAVGSYIKSLAEAFSDHAATRTTKDQEDMAARIVTLRSSIAVANAQKAIAAVNQLLANKDFLGASDALDAAARDWAQSQSDTYPPFDSLRLNIQNAVELSQGREISSLDPKADIVNGFIKSAQDNLAGGKLQAATQNVNDALAVAPNYGAAKVLKLQIQKQTNPVKFQTDAGSQMTLYTNMARSSVPEDQRTAYNALLDYSKLDPRFSTQLAPTIRELEYQLNLVRRPPTPAQINQSNTLVAQANARQQEGSPEAYQAALDLLKQAIQINPDNAAASVLYGQIVQKRDAAAPVTLSPADAAKYAQARDLANSGSYQNAYDLVMEVWKTPRNQGYASLKLLKKKLEVLLNLS